MDFLDSLDLHTLTRDRKSDRVRSWYLLEQYKSLENHQLDAAQRLRNRSLQERLLHQELTERRARRRLYAPSDSCRSEPRDNRHQSHGSRLSSTADDFYESFCEIHDFECGQEFDRHSHDSDNTYTEDFKTLEDYQDDTSCADSGRSVVDVSETGDTRVSKFADKGDSRSQSVQRTIADSIKLHLETVKENMVSLERYTRMGDGDLSSEESAKTTRRPKPDKILYKSVLLRDNQLFCLWSRLVTFAYHIVQLNHGNCYYDYGSQLLTAVLACDALRRGVNRMCDFLQSYVSPVKFASDSSENSSIDSSKKQIRKKKSYVSKKIRNNSQYKINSSFHKTCVTKCSEGKGYSDQLRQHYRRYSFEHKMGKHRTANHYCGYYRDCRRAEASASTLWPPEERSYEWYRRHRAVRPVLRLARYLDDILTDIEDFGYE